MPDIVISVENISKSYQLGVIGTGTFRGDLTRWWAKQRGLPDPFLKIGETDYGNREGETIWALNDVSIAIQQGEALGIIGRNGAGKSTLLKILSQVTAPTSGEVKVKGRIASLLEVGTGFHPELTGRENIYLNGAILGMNREETRRKFDEIVDFSGVEKFIDTPVKRYSSGMYVRLAFAVAAHLESEILIVDEVLAVGDAEFQRKCLGKMGDVAHEGRTVLFVSHNMGAVKNLCESCVWLDKGKIKTVGTSNAVISSYMSLLTADSTGEAIVPKRQGAQAQFSRIAVIGKNGLPTSMISVTSSFSIRLEYHVEQKLNNLEVSFSVFDKNFSKIFYSGKTIESSIPGKYAAEAKIPALFLAPGPYTVTAAIHQPNIQLFDRLESVTSFSILDDSTNYKFLNRDMGAILVSLDWDIRNAK
jgi:lipopolysaccharide transport system ATP-binding protein